MNGRKVTIEKELFFFKYIGIHYAKVATKVTSVVGHGDWMLNIEFQDITVKDEELHQILYSKVPFIINWLQPNFQVLQMIESEC